MAQNNDYMGFKAGIYAFLPFDKYDRGRGLFKVGMTTGSYKKLISRYNTYFPAEYYLAAYYEIDYNEDDKRKRFLKIEKEMSAYIKKNGGEVFRKANRDRMDGESEWFLCKLSLLHDAFETVAQKYNPPNNKNKGLHLLRLPLSKFRNEIISNHQGHIYDGSIMYVFR